MAKIGWTSMNRNDVISKMPAGRLRNFGIAGFFLAAFLAMKMVLSAPLHACPMCGDILERGKDAVKAMRFSQGIGWSILVMLAVPYSIIGTLIWTIVRAQKRKQSSLEDLPQISKPADSGGRMS